MPPTVGSQSFLSQHMVTKECGCRRCEPVRWSLSPNRSITRLWWQVFEQHWRVEFRHPWDKQEVPMQAVERVDAGNQNQAECRVEHAIWASRGPGGQVIVENQGATHGVCTCPEDHLLRDFSRIPKEFVGPTTIAFRIVVEGIVRRLCADIRDDLYLIGQEGLVNAFRHSRATEVEAQIVYTVDRFQMYIRDNGCGIDPRTLATARIRQLGLSSMRERADRIGAKLRILSRAS